MAKKSSSNAVRKIDKQIKELSTDEEKDVKKESVPIINKKEIDEKIKKTSVSDSKSTSKRTSNRKGNVRDKIIVADGSRGKNARKLTAKTTTAKRNTKKATDSSMKNKKDILTSVEDNKIKKLEDEIRSLYDRVNDIVDSLEYEKTVVETDDIMLNDFVSKEKVSDTKLDKVSVTFLDRVLMIVFVIFMTMFTAFIGFVIFVSTF